MANTTIIIPGREAQVINGLVMTASDVVAAYSGDVDLSSMTQDTQETADGVTITFANRTGTKGNINISVNVEGDVNIVGTRIIIPGREAQNIPNIAMTANDVIAAFAGDVDLSRMTNTVTEEDNLRVITFANRTGTKGQVNLIEQVLQAAVAELQNQNTGAVAPELSPAVSAAPAVPVTTVVEEFDEEPEIVNTLISIPGREDQYIEGVVLDATMVKSSFSGELDLSGFTVEEIENGDTLEVRFTARTGTKG